MYSTSKLARTEFLKSSSSAEDIESEEDVDPDMDED